MLRPVFLSVPLIELALAVPVLAGDYALPSRVTDVTLYPGGATVTRRLDYDLPAGAHQLVLTDLPRDTDLASLRAETGDLRMTGIRSRAAFALPNDPEKSAALQAAEDRLEALETRLRDAQDEVNRLSTGAYAAEMQKAFLSDLGKADGVGQLAPDQIRVLLALIGEETAQVMANWFAATRKVEDATRALEDLERDVDLARQARDALLTGDDRRATVVLAVEAAEPVAGTVVLRYQLGQAGWQPVYDYRLDRDSGVVTVERGALVTQNSGEDWTEVRLALSTRRPSGQTAASGIHPDIRRIGDPMRKQVLHAPGAGADMARAAPVALEAAPVIEDGGLSVTYRPEAPVSVANGADNVRIALAPVRADAEVRAVAVPLSDDRAYLTATIVNDAAEPLMATDAASFHVGSRFVGRRYMPMVAAGAEVDLAFGPIDGLTLERQILGKQEGDRGLLRTSTELKETVRIRVRNLTGEDWPVRLLDRVPVSEQTDLAVSWSADPVPSVTDLDQQRGVLAWDFGIGAGETRDVVLDYQLKWPQDKVLYPG